MEGQRNSKRKRKKDLSVSIRRMKFDLSMEDFTIILNALHYYKKVEKRGEFQRYDGARINQLRDKLSHQLVWDQEL